MKISLNLSRARTAGFTLVEVYMASAIALMLVIAITAVEFFAAHVYTLAATKLTSTAAGRQVMNQMRDAIRGADDVKVGIYDPVANTFSTIAIGTPQIGNALVIYTNNPNGQNTNSGTIYFMNTQASNVCSVVYSNNTVLPSTIVTNIAVYITNYYAFDAEDSLTNILTTYVNNRVIHVKFQFCQWEFPLAGVAGQNAMYDYYQLQTRATRRIIDY
jgi:type II secretory pathway pseudopilin PulG